MYYVGGYISAYANRIMSVKKVSEKDMRSKQMINILYTLNNIESTCVRLLEISKELRYSRRLAFILKEHNTDMYEIEKALIMEINRSIGLSRNVIALLSQNAQNCERLTADIKRNIAVSKDRINELYQIMIKVKEKVKSIIDKDLLEMAEKLNIFNTYLYHILAELEYISTKISS